ncbi:hypothetical protein PR1_155 [Providencia phage vB_PreS_PR1]|uniref:Uncharacterized protein n=1 Tax=Providencia phage vB_PreS_PR1 TaxID=1931407 RepID=A0A1S6KV17_9CAUD|nr:hypothetical protein FDH30_gp059 [Providencia phage vB_PreS_PR1]AQT25259.1 hypothetical protein PR1_155 [Providencia phage vB_PreS_PR1]
MEVIYKTFNGTARTDLILRGERANLLKFDQSHILGEVLKATPVHNLTNRLIDLYIVFNNKETTVIKEVTSYEIRGEYGEYKDSCELYLLPPIPKGPAWKAEQQLLSDHSAEIIRLFNSCEDLDEKKLDEIHTRHERLEREAREAARIEFTQSFSAAKDQLISWIKPLGWSIV